MWNILRTNTSQLTSHSFVHILGKMLDEKGNTTIIPISGCVLISALFPGRVTGRQIALLTMLCVWNYLLSSWWSTLKQKCAKALDFILRVIAWEFTHMLRDSIYQGNLKCRDFFTPFGKNCIHCKVDSDWISIAFSICDVLLNEENTHHLFGILVVVF